MRSRGKNSWATRKRQDAILSGRLTRRPTRLAVDAADTEAPFMTPGESQCGHYGWSKAGKGRRACGSCGNYHRLEIFATTSIQVPEVFRQ